MSIATGRLLSRLSRGEGVMERIHCQRRETVRDTFCGYDFRVLDRRTEPEDLWDLNFLPSFFAGEECWAYLWSVTSKRCVYYKVGISRNVHSRFRAFRTGLPPRMKVRAEAALLLENVAFAEKCEWSVLAACVDLWRGGEWLCEPRVKIGGVDGR